MNDQRPRTYVYRGTVPLWLVLVALLPLGAVFLTSIVLAVLIAGAGAALATLVLPLFWKRPAGPDTSKTIDLDPSQYRRIDSRD
jgi:hypothetical protein